MSTRLRCGLIIVRIGNPKQVLADFFIIEFS